MGITAKVSKLPSIARYPIMRIILLVMLPMQWVEFMVREIRPAWRNSLEDYRTAVLLVKKHKLDLEKL